ncbi:unnamed protein product [Leptidea sinapis]|uniref:DUF4776 domain-containing protein n=1 Tax=Leptidea sinapis TaxID=189913 RepID=A0A5E4PMJ3_9NEOP|nr:unnamed protein product [Leptidea sinapis]
MSKNDDGLFLLEAFIDKIVFVKSPCFSDRDFRTCVNIECSSIEPLEICDDDTTECIARSGGPFIKTFNCGKSCLFSLKESDISTAMSKFPIKVTVYKSLPCGCLPTKIIMGQCTIDMTKEFVETRKKFLEDPTSVSYEALKDSFRIVDPEGEETGDIVMFLRISCFGKLIITKFQGSGVPTLGAGGKSTSGVIDRSCAPRKDFQTMDDPCVCGAARGHGRSGIGGIEGNTCSGANAVCPPAPDPYNSMPCQDPDDPCYCTGPKPQPKQQMLCRNTDQYCLHVPKGVRSLPFYQDLSHEIQKSDLIRSILELQHVEFLANKKYMNIILMSPDNYRRNYLERSHLKQINNNTSNDSIISESNCNSITFKNGQCNTLFKAGNPGKKPLFGQRETTVYMAFFNKLCDYQTSGTQATASINKCFQVNGTSLPLNYSNASSFSTSMGTTSTTRDISPYYNDKERYVNVYLFGRNKTNQKGLGDPNTKPKRTVDKSSSSATKCSDARIGPCDSKPIIKSKKSHNKMKSQNTSSSQTKSVRGTTTATNALKSVSIKDDKLNKPCPAIGVTEGDMMVTISHIKIAPRETCPVHGKEPCQGPKCIVAAAGADKAPVKVSTSANPRRGVFELVIRRMTGAPLAKNELMLEWTPPPSHPPPCSTPCPMPCPVPIPCRPSKCRMIVCRPSPCKPKCFKKKPCGQPCFKCCKPPCKPCPIPRYRISPPCNPCSACCVFPPPFCKKPCAPPCCGSPCGAGSCKSSPCLRPCPVGRKRTRRTKSQPKIRGHRKRTSPCNNRKKTCPVVKCRSMPGCCDSPPLCPPRKCCSVLHCKPKCC